MEQWQGRDGTLGLGGVALAQDAAGQRGDELRIGADALDVCGFAAGRGDGVAYASLLLQIVLSVKDCVRLLGLIMSGSFFGLLSVAIAVALAAETSADKGTECPESRVLGRRLPSRHKGIGSERSGQTYSTRG